MLLTLNPEGSFKPLIHVQALPSRLELPIVSSGLGTELGGSSSSWVWEVLGFLSRAAGQALVKGKLKCLNGVKFDTSFHSPV